MKDLKLFGSSILQDENKTRTLAKEVIAHEQFSLLHEAIKGIVPFDKGEFSVLDAFVFEGKKEGADEDYVRAKVVIISFNKNRVIVRAAVGERNRKPVYDILATVEDQSFITTFFVKDDKVVKGSKRKLTDELKEEILNSIENDKFPENEHYKEGMLTGEVTPLVQRFFDGCLWGGYRWCGKGCSNYRERGGDETVINSTDDCCRTHDYCYLKGLVDRGTCDNKLCSCAQGKDTNAATLIRLYYC